MWICDKSDRQLSLYFKQNLSSFSFSNVICCFSVFSMIRDLIYLKGTVHPKIKNPYFTSFVEPIISLGGFGVSCLVLEFGEFFLNIMGVNGVLNMVPTAPPKIQQQTQQQCLFPKIMTVSLKIISRSCCETFHVGTIFLLTGTAHNKVCGQFWVTGSWLLKRDITVEFKIYFFCTVSITIRAPFTPIILEKR